MLPGLRIITDTAVKNLPAQEIRVPDKHQTGPVYARLRLKAAARCTHPSHTHTPPRFSARSQLSSLSTRFDSSSIKSASNTNTLQRYLAETRGAPQCHPRPVWLPQLSEATQDDYSSHSLKSLNLFSSPGAARWLRLKRTPRREFKSGLAAAARPRSADGTPCACRVLEGPKGSLRGGGWHGGGCDGQRVPARPGFLHPSLKTGSDRSSCSFLWMLDSTATAPWDKRENRKACVC